MDPPPVQYVKTSDGYDIAYAISGQGRPFVFMPTPFSHVHLYWTEKTFLLPWLEGLSARFRLVQYDGRGQGMSSRGIEHFSMVDYEGDLEAVLDGLQLGGFVLMGTSWLAHAAVRYAARNPGRIKAVVLSSSSLSALAS